MGVKEAVGELDGEGVGVADVARVVVVGSGVCVFDATVFDGVAVVAFTVGEGVAVAA
ncbi:MAG: hypothetical protein R6V13_11025 [Anaerolineae bacterium]